MLLLLLLQLTGSAAAAVAAGAAPGRRPNIIMALGDDTGWHGVGWHQSSECQSDPSCAMQTPRMDALLKDGVELDQHYTYRFCSPTRAALMTGRLPIHVNQMNSAEYPWTAAAMHPSFVTVADALRSKAG
jgi:arylsulfatase B